MLDAYEDHGSSIPSKKRIMDYGNPDLHGDKGGPQCGEECEWAERGKDVCPNLVHAMNERDNRKLGSVMVRTVGSSDEDGERTAQALDKGIGGVVYGYGHAEYEDIEMMIKAKSHVDN